MMDAPSLVLPVVRPVRLGSIIEFSLFTCSTMVGADDNNDTATTTAGESIVSGKGKEN